MTGNPARDDILTALTILQSINLEDEVHIIQTMYEHIEILLGSALTHLEANDDDPEPWTQLDLFGGGAGG